MFGSMTLLAKRMVASHSLQSETAKGPAMQGHMLLSTLGRLLRDSCGAHVIRASWFSPFMKCLRASLLVV